ncbi:MAG: hypothetical protein KDK66_03195 [Deltaproteobacteria bacterium]|nr:hypothetical protein [Deltaproteobacteria bacterium]
MKRFFKLCFCLLILLLSFQSCSTSQVGGSEAGNPEPVQIALLAYSSSVNAATSLKTSSLSKFLTSASLQVGSLQIDRAEIVLGELRIRPFSLCDVEESLEEEFRFRGPYIVDLLETPPVSLMGVEIISGLYCKLEMRLEKLETSSAGIIFPLGNSVFIEGLRSDDTPFQVLLETDEEFELQNESTGFEINADLSLDHFFIAFDLDQWFAGVDLSDPGVEVSVDGQGDPIILINQDHNTELREVIVENLKLSADFFEDQDDDGQLDQDEQDPEDSLAEGSLVI